MQETVQQPFSLVACVDKLEPSPASDCDCHLIGYLDQIFSAPMRLEIRKNMFKIIARITEQVAYNPRTRGVSGEVLESSL